MTLLTLSALLMLIGFVVLIFIGAPIAIAIGISSIAGILPTLDVIPALITSAQRIFSGISVFTLLAIPFFILAGNIMNRGGIARRLLNLANLLLGTLPGGLAISNILANALFGSVSGSGLAAASAMGSTIGPMQEEQGYDKNFSAATNIGSAPTGLLIPPSNVLITYSLVSGGTSVGALFVAGYIPGLLWAIGMMVTGVIMAKRHGYIGESRPEFKEAIKIIIEAIPSLLLIVIIVGGIIAGIYTATEASCIAVIYSLILSLIYKSMSFNDFIEVLKESAETTGIIMFLIGASNIMGWVMSFVGIPEMIASLLLGFTNSKVVILIIMNIILLIVGMFMDITPAVLIFTPIFLPICMEFGMHPIQFGIMITYNLCIGGITPPVGNILYLGARVGNTSVEEVMPWLLKYYFPILLVLLMITFIPMISMLLPTAANLV